MLLTLCCGDDAHATAASRREYQVRACAAHALLDGPGDPGQLLHMDALC